LTSGAELALCPHAQQATHCAPSRTRRNPHACTQDMWHTHTFGIDAARERLPRAPRAPPQLDRRWHCQRHGSRIPLPPRSTACTTAWCRTCFDASSGTWCTARAIAAVST
jgi:hypothetical protein